MQELQQVQNEIVWQVRMWAPRLAELDGEILTGRRNSQNRTVKQIVGHLIDSASNNLHRIIHLQYQQSPLQFPDYANLGINDTWIAVQNYLAEEWALLVQLWQSSNLHLAHVIGNVDGESLDNIWVSALGEKIRLFDMIVDYPRHLTLHLREISQLLDYEKCGGNSENGRYFNEIQRTIEKQLQFYRDKLLYEIDSWDLAEMIKSDADVVVIDARSQEAYAAEHIAAAVNLPHRGMTFDSTRGLDPQKTYVTYCDGIGCNASTKGALKLTQLGFNVRELLGGIDWWKRDGYPIESDTPRLDRVAACGCS